jgi:hypothetical protein
MGSNYSFFMRGNWGAEKTPNDFYSELQYINDRRQLRIYRKSKDLGRLDNLG